jgi:hypothetical protein
MSGVGVLTGNPEPVDRGERWDKLALLVGIDEYQYFGVSAGPSMTS